MTWRRLGGFTLLEVIAAMAVFGLAAVSVVSVLGRTGHSVSKNRMRMHAMTQVESILQARSKFPALEPGEETLGPDREGVIYTLTIEEADLPEPDQGAELADLLWVRVTAVWPVGNREEEYYGETLRYEGLFR